jgi:hypothetical protein
MSENNNQKTLVPLDPQKFFNKIGIAHSMAADVATLVDGIDELRGDAENRAYRDICAGAFALMRRVMNQIYCLTSELDGDFSRAYDVKCPYQMSEKERREWIEQGGVW